MYLHHYIKESIFHPQFILFSYACKLNCVILLFIEFIEQMETFLRGSQWTWKSVCYN